MKKAKDSNNHTSLITTIIILALLALVLILGPAFNLSILFLLLIPAFIYTYRQSTYSTSGQKKSTSKNNSKASKSSSSDKNKIKSNMVVNFLYLTLAYSLLGWLAILLSLFASGEGASGTEYYGLAAMIFIIQPSFAVLMIYTIIFSLTDNKRYTPDALSGRKKVLKLSWLTWLGAYVLVSVLANLA